MIVSLLDIAEASYLSDFISNAIMNNIIRWIDLVKESSECQYIEYLIEN